MRKTGYYEQGEFTGFRIHYNNNDGLFPWAKGRTKKEGPTPFRGGETYLGRLSGNRQEGQMPPTQQSDGPRNHRDQDSRQAVLSVCLFSVHIESFLDDRNLE
jgi:hypothetical protein